MTTHLHPINTSDRWLPAELCDVTEYTFRPYRGERKVLRKRKPIQPSQWAPRHRVVTKGSRRGLWRNETVPYAQPVLDAMARAHVETVNLCWSPQSAKSETINTFVGWLIDRRPGDVLFVYPDEKTANENSRDRIQPMITSSRRLSEFATGYADDMAATRVALEHMALYFGWASSPASLANKPLPYVVCDETDKYPETASKKEAGPVGLAEARATVFRGRRKFIRASTPTVPSAFIWQALKKCRAVFVYWVRCPLCGKWQRMELARVRVPKDVRDPEEIKDRDLAWYACAGCGEQWDDHLRDRAVAAGQWRHREKGVEMFAYLEAFKPKTIGFHLPSWNSPFVGLSEVMAAWFKGQTDKTALKDFFNRYAAEPWVIREKERKEDAILALREPRPMGRVPGDGLVSCLTFGADTQDNGFWFKIVANGWGLERDAWVVRCGFVPNFAALARVLWSDAYEDAAGTRYVVRFGLIDAMGHRTGEVYDFCRAHPGRIMPAKGEKIMNQPLAYTRIEYYPGTKKPIPGALQLVRVNTKYFKDQLAAALTVKGGDPGSIRMPEDLPRDYAVHYTAEFINEKGDWDCRPNVPNHLWDCGVLSSCAAEILQVRFWEKPPEEKPAPKPKNIPGPPPRVKYERPSWLEGR